MGLLIGLNEVRLNAADPVAMGAAEYVAPTWPIIRRFALLWSAWGASIGILFAVSLLLAERNRPLDRVRRWRVAVWGALSALGLPMLDWRSFSLDWDSLGAMTFIASLGSFCAYLMIRIAQRPASAAVRDSNPVV